MKTTRAILLFLTIVTAISCHKVVTDCEYIVKPYVMQDKTLSMASGVFGYGFYADTVQYTLLDYDDALDGVLVSKSTGERLPYDVRAEQDADGLLSMTFTSEPVTVVLCNQTNGLYAFRQIDVQGNLKRLQVSMAFNLDDTASLYTASGWTVGRQYPYVAPEEPASGE